MTINKKASLKQKVKHEVRLYFIYTLFLSVLLFSFVIYQRLLLNEYTAQYIPYGYSVIQAMILAKIILIGENLTPRNVFTDKPLIYLVLYKTVFFCILLLLFSLVEHLVYESFKGKTIIQIYGSFSLNEINIRVARLVIMFFVFIFFFSFIELDRALGGDRLYQLFFQKKKDDIKS